LELLEDGVLTVRSSNHQFAATGKDGGLSPKPSRVIVNPDRPDREELGVLETRALKAGDVVRFERSGGAGFGPPGERDPIEIRADVRDGYVSREAAQSAYGWSKEDDA
jgi:N-methylhydantoinase B